MAWSSVVHYAIHICVPNSWYNPYNTISKLREWAEVSCSVHKSEWHSTFNCCALTGPGYAGRQGLEVLPPQPSLSYPLSTPLNCLFTQCVLADPGMPSRVGSAPPPCPSLSHPLSTPLNCLFTQCVLAGPGHACGGVEALQILNEDHHWNT